MTLVMVAVNTCATVLVAENSNLLHWYVIRESFAHHSRVIRSSFASPKNVLKFFGKLGPGTTKRVNDANDANDANDVRMTRMMCE